jgi:regulator of protease activity HflC (stomatin/prohibitin superfamily)
MEVENTIKEETAKVLKVNNIDMRALLIRSITLPPQIKEAIENKLKQEQEALAYKFKLDKERSEAERKRIEAEGIAKYNQILSSSLTDKILQQKGIDATIELSKSQNTKVIVIGSGDSGMPLILGDK